MLAIIIAAGYLLWMYQRTAFGNPKSEFEHEHIHDVHLPEYIAWAPMLVLIVVLGIVPSLVFRQTDGPVHSTVTAAFVESGQPQAPGQSLPTQSAPSP